MDGLNKITERIAADARAEADAILADGKAEAREITAQWQAKADRETAAILAQAEKDANQRAKRLEDMAHMEGRKLLLEAKQECIAAAFDKALADLLSLPQEEYVDLLARLAVKAASTGREELIFSDADKARVGAKVAQRANDLLARQVAPQLPEELKNSAAGALLDKAVTRGAAFAKGTAMLTVAEETRPIKGGFILSGEGVEVNCAFETLVRLARPELERQVAQALLGE